MKKECGIPSETPVHRAIRALNEAGTGAILISDEGRPVGILTDRQVVERLTNGSVDAMNAPVREVMWRDVQTVAIDHGLSEVLGGLKKTEAGFLAVVDERGKGIGLVSYPDLIRLMGFELSELGGHCLNSAGRATPVEIIDKAA